MPTKGADEGDLLAESSTAGGPRASPTQSRKSFLRTVGEGLAPPAVSRKVSRKPTGRSGTGSCGEPEGSAPPVGRDDPARCSVYLWENIVGATLAVVRVWCGIKFRPPWRGKAGRAADSRPYGGYRSRSFFCRGRSQTGPQLRTSYHLFGQTRRSRGTAPAEIFANPGPSGPGGI